MALAADVSLGSRYHLISQIAVGGMGEVWRAEDTVLNREVAVKVLRGDLAGDPSFLERFRAEARHAAGLAHPGIASVYDYGEVASEGAREADTAYLVMALIDGEPLSAMLAREGRLPADRSLDILAQTARALEAAHVAGVIHRDVKPGNLLLQPDGAVKITDFGIARAVNAAPVTATGMVMGTAYYLSPEQAASRPVAPTSDVYSLGVVGYEMLAGRRPFAGDNPVAVAMMHIRDQPPPLPDDVPPAARAVIERAMAKDPAARFPTAAAMGVAATAARADAPAPAATAPLTTAMPPVTDAPGLASTRVLPAVSMPVATGPVAPGAVAPGPPAPRRAAGRRWSGRYSWPRPAVLLIGALLLATLVTVLVKATSAPRTAHPSLTPGASAGSQPAPTPAVRTVQVTASDYVGRPFADVKSALAGKGLVVREILTGKGAAAGTVTALVPTGAVAVGDTVTVTVVPEGRKRKGKH